MKFNAKLLVIALIVAMIFSIGAVSAAENIGNITSSDFTQVPHEQVVSVVEPTVQEVETIDLETSDNTEIAQTMDITSSSDNLKSTDSIKNESLRENKKVGSVLGASNQEDVLSDTIYVYGNTFSDLRTAISNARDGDIIDLQNQTIYGFGGQISFSKKITIANGALDGNSYLTNYKFENCILENLTISNLHTSWGTSVNYCNLKNVAFDNVITDKGCDFAVRYCNLENVNFTNCHSLMPADPHEEDFETGVMIVTYDSNFNNCYFVNCSSKRHSGAICVAGLPGNTANITNCVFDNCTSGVGGAVYLHGTGLSENHHSNIINCTFKNCEATEWGGALGSSQDFLNVENCKFENNSAKQGAAFMVGGITHGLDGDNSQGHHNTMKNCYFYNNTGTEEGGAVHITGNYNSAIDCTFDDNFALNGKGAAIYVEGHHASVQGSNFTKHESEMGTVYVEGDDFSCTHSTFEDNYAEHGGAGIYVEGHRTYISDSIFRRNNASMHGGAIHTIGNNARILNSEFRENNAIPSSTNPDYGLGGAIYIDGKDNEISYSKFKHNTARNGSAIYNSGDDLVLNDDLFENNQAWSYFLFTEAKPPEAYWSEDLEFLVNVTLVAGDNLINAIYNDRAVDEIYFHNVTYTLKPTELYPTGIKTTTPEELHPVDGVDASQGGKYLYQDAHEDDQVVNINITFKDGKVFEYSGKTDMHGSVAFPITKDNMTDGQFHPGVYTLNAEHPDDEIYTHIKNSTTFTILPHVDVSVTKTSNKDVYFVGENAIFTIRVAGVGTNATNVKVKDILPKSLKFVSDSATKGTYDSVNNVWDIGFLPHLASETLTLTVQTTELGTFDNVVNVTCTEKDWNLSNNVDNKTIHVDLYYTKEVNVTQTSAGEYVEYYLRVFNTGTSDYTETVLVRDLMPEGIRFETFDLVGADLIRFTNYAIEQVWEITNISAGYRAKITVKALTLKDGLWNNTMIVWNYPPVNTTVNVSSNADLQIIKSASVVNVNKGDIFNWTITVINHGPSIAFNVYVDDTLPAGLEIVGHATPAPGTRFDRSTGRWTIGTLGVEDYVTLIIPTRVTSVVGNNITNVAVVNGTTPDPDPSNNKDNDTVYYNPDVGITKIVSDRNAYHNEIISWILTVTNYGPNAATGVYVIDKLPAGLTYISSTNNAYNPVTGRWTIGTLQKNESVVLTINTRVTIYDGFISNNATVYATNDNNDENNYADDFTQVTTEADVGVVKLVSNQTSRYGDEIVWTVIVTNYGPSVAENVVLIDFLPIDDLKQTRQPTVSKGQISHQGITGRWDIGDMAVGETQSCQVYTKVITTDKTIINVVSVTSDTEDPNLSNNRAENGTYVPPECDVQVIKNVNDYTPNKGDSVTWTIAIVNVGPNAAQNVVVTDVLPGGLKYVSHAPVSQGSFDNTRGVWTVGTLEVNQRLTLTIKTDVVDTGTITNEVNVTTSTYDTDLNNNYANETIEVPAIADLVITKVVSNKNATYGELINWTITVTNKGPNTARNVIVEDGLPEGLIYIIHKSNPRGLLYDYVHGIWQIRDLASSQSVSLVITTRVNVTNATITNIAVVTSDTPDYDTSNNEANNTTHVSPLADLEIIKFVDNHSPKKGDNVTWTVIVTNKGPDTAINAIAREILPEGLILIRAYPTGQSSYDHNTNTWYLQNMTKGQSINMTVVTQVNVTKKVLTNIIVVTSDTPDPDLSNNEANATIDVGHDADLGIIKTVSNSTPNYGDEITWTITVKNNGPDDAVDVFVNDTLPKGLVWISDNGNGTYNHYTGIWTIGTLTNQSSITLTIRTLVNITNANITNIAVVDSDTNDPTPENNTDNDTIKVRPEADLLLYKFVNIHNSNYNNEVVWTIYVRNNGPDTAVDAYVYDKLPTGLIYSKSNATVGKYDNNTGIWTIGNFTKGSSAYLTIFTIVNITNGTITNYAVVNSSTYDPNPDNNNDTDTTEVESVADLEVIKEVSNKKPHFGEEITWTITVTNHGPSEAINVTVKDDLPKGLIYKTSDTVTGKYDNNTGIWTIGNLTKGSKVVLTITTLVNITNATITNVAVVNSTTPDNNTENNKGNNTTNVPPEADLEIIKLVSNSTAHKGDVITWTIIVTNKGPDSALEVYVRDTLPSGLVLTGYSRTKGIFDSNSGTWYIKSLAKGEKQTLTLTTLVNVTNKTLENIVSVTNDVYDPNETNNEANNTTNVDPEADLEVIKTAMNSTYNKGDIVVWNITVINHGPDAAVDVRLVDVAQEGLVFINKTYGFYNGAQIIGENLGTLQSGESITLFIRTLVNTTNATLENEVVVFAVETHDPNPDNNYDNDTIKVNPQANLVVEKFVSANVTKTGDVITWTIKVTNNGPDVAVNTKVTDKLPAGLIYNGHTGEGNYDPETGVWIVGDLAKGDSKVLEIQTIVNITNKTIVNVANVTSDTPGNRTNGTNNTTSFGNVADLEVIKLVSNATPKRGDEITWTIIVTNHGPDKAIGVNVTDKLPAGLRYNGHDGPGFYDSSKGIWIIGDLAKDDTVKLVIRTIVEISNGTIENIAVVNSSTPDNNTDNNKGNNTTTVNDDADLVIVKVVSNKNPKFGEEITWTITVTNKGPSDAKNVRVTDKLPAGLIFNGSNGNYNPATGLWIVGDLANGKSVSLVIKTIVNITNTTITNIANVTSDTPDSNKTNNEANNTTDVGPKADLIVVKEVSKQTVKTGEVITWTVTVTNKGPDTAVNTRVTDKLPAGLIFITSDGNYDPITGVWIVGDLANRASAKLVITTQVNITNATIRNVANVTSDTPGNNTPGNNTTDVDPKADLVVVKVVSNKNPKFGEEITWTVTVTNKGPDTAVNVRVTDKLPAGLIFNGANGNYDPITGVWIVGDLANGASASLVIRTQVNITNATIRNVANATSDTPGNNTPGNNTTDVDPKADLVVVKVVSNKNPKFGEEITWTVTVTNKGPDTAVNVRVTDKLPAGLIFNGANGNYDPITGVWIVGDLANGASASLVIRTQVNITNATIRNVANVTSDTPGNNTPGNNTTDVPPEADLEIIKLVSNKTTSKGEIITWTIIVTNHGPDAAENVYVKDSLPNGLELKSYTRTKGLFDSNSMTWFINKLNNGESATLTINTLVNVSDVTLVNYVNATNDVYDPNESNNKANNTTTVDKELGADLAIIKVVSDSNPRKGDIINWIIFVTNNGPGDAHGVTVTDKLPAGLIFKGADGNYNPDTGIWTIGDLKNGQTISLVIITLVDITNAQITNVAVVNSTTPDNNTDNNKDNDTTNVDPEADIKVIKTVSNPTPTKGDTITWTITVINLGPDAAKDVIVEDDLPEGLKLLSARGSKGAFDSGIWTIGTLNKGESATLVITTQVTTSGTTIRNIAVGTTTTYDPNKTNNRDSDVTRPKDKPVAPSADLEIIKYANVEKVKVGDKIIWKISVYNYGPDAAENVRVKDVLYGDAEYLSSKASKGTFDPLEGVWIIGDMKVGEEVVLTIICKALSEGIVVNTAEVVSDTPDPNMSNNKDMSVVNVEKGDNPVPPTPETPKTPENPETPATMHATGNPIVMVLLALFALVGVSLRRKD